MQSISCGAARQNSASTPLNPTHIAELDTHLCAKQLLLRAATRREHKLKETKAEQRETAACAVVRARTRAHAWRVAIDERAHKFAQPMNAPTKKSHLEVRVRRAHTRKRNRTRT
jgi:hypothetical protein